MATHELDPLLTQPGITVRQAWEKINANRNHILFVVDEQQRLLGSIGDGDVRRWILSEKGIEENVCRAMNHNPITVSEFDSREIIENALLANNISCVPLLDEDGVVMDLHFLVDLVEKRVLERHTRSIPDVPVVIMAGGVGSRLNPFTKILPKPLIPVGDKPIIETIIDRFLKYDITRYFISVNYKANFIKAYFKDTPHSYDLTFFQEDSPLGTAGSLSLIRSHLKSVFFLSNCDILIDADYRDILDFHRKNKAAMTLVCSMKRSQIPYGVVEINPGGRLRGIVEKPEYHNLVNTGFYVMSPPVLDLLKKDEPCDMTTLIDRATEEKMKIVVYPISDKDWIDMGQLEEYQHAIKKLERL